MHRGPDPEPCLVPGYLRTFFSRDLPRRVSPFRTPALLQDDWICSYDYFTGRGCPLQSPIFTPMDRPPLSRVRPPRQGRQDTAWLWWRQIQSSSVPLWRDSKYFCPFPPVRITLPGV